MPDSLSNLPYSNNIIANSLNERNPFPKVYDISMGYNNFTRFVDKLNPSGPKKVESDIYEQGTIDNLNIATPIGTFTLIAGGQAATLAFADPSYGNFREGDIVMDSNMVQGRVSSVGTGNIVLQPWSIDLFTAAHFVAGSTVKMVSDASIIHSSKGRNSLFETPRTDFNYTQVIRETQYLSRRDISLKTYPRFDGKYWYAAQEEYMVKRFARQREFAAIFGTRQRKNTPQGPVDTNGGLIWSIKNRGGLYISSPNELTEDAFQDYIADIVTKNASRGRKFQLFYGVQCLATLQRFISNNWLKFVGRQNTFGGDSVRGLNVMVYEYLGVEIEFIPLEIFDDQKYFPEVSSITGRSRMSSSFFLIDSSPVEAADGGTLPAIETLYRGPKEINYGYIPGMIGPDGANPSSYLQGDKMLMASDVDGVSCQMLSEPGINIVTAKNMMFFELSN